MGFANVTGHVEAAPETVFAYLALTRRLSEWCVLVNDVRPTADDLDHVGATFEGLIRIAGREVHTTWTVTHVDAPRSLRLDGTASDGTATFGVTTSPWDGGTEVTMEVDYSLPGGMVRHAADRLFLERTIIRELRHSMTNLAAIVVDHPDI